jgi:hypothetical protein
MAALPSLNLTRKQSSKRPKELMKRPNQKIENYVLRSKNYVQKSEMIMIDEIRTKKKK